MERKLKILDGEVTLQIEHTEQKLVKDYDAKFTRQSKAILNELQLRCDSLKEEVVASVMEEVHTNFKNELLKTLNDKIKESGKAWERTLQERLSERSHQIEDLIGEQ